MTIFCIGISCQEVKAESFYEAEKIDNLFTKSVDSQSTHYQKARFFRRKSDNKEAYCLEPFAYFDETASYGANNTPINIDENTWKKLSLIAHFGYGYQNHTEQKWYAITQLMIWQEVEPTKDFYFTSSLNGPKIEIYQEEMNEINNLINNFNTVPSLNYNTNNIVGKKVIITDTNNVLNNYKIEETNNNIKIENNQLIIENLKKGEQKITLKRKMENTDNSALFYYNSKSQNLMTRGATEEKVLQVLVNGTTNKITIKKIDRDTQSTIPSGDAILINAIYGLYDSNNNLIKKLTIDKDSTATIENLDYGKYYIKELAPGEGYTLNNEIKWIEITDKTTNVELILENKVIEKEITIHKEYGNKNNTINEANISFDIYNSKNELVTTITTDKNGDAKVILPYGKYTVKQRNTNTGYNKVDDFEINITDEESDYYYKLYDYKIEVPNTRVKENNSYLLLILILCLLPLIKKHAN